MSGSRPNRAMRIKLTAERRERMLRALTGYFSEHFDEQISPFKAEQLLDFLVGELGPLVYNQAIRDAHAFIQEKLRDLEGEFYEPE
jgi:uncharacterized protein (DUF2164 family)